MGTTPKSIQKRQKHQITLGSLYKKENGELKDGAQKRTGCVTMELTKRKKQQRMQVTLWQKNYLQVGKKVTSSTFLTTLNVKRRKEKDHTISENFKTTNFIKFQICKAM